MLELETKVFGQEMGPQFEVSNTAVAREVLVKGKPSAMSIVVKPPDLLDTHGYIVDEGKATPFTSTLKRPVKVAWENGWPRTRLGRGSNNVDVVAICDEGCVIDTVVSITTRKNRIFLVVENHWEGRVTEKAFVPDWPHNYPKANPLNQQTWAAMFQEIRRIAEERNAFASSDTQPAEWEAHFPPHREGWESGTVAWYSHILPGGGIYPEAGGDIVFAHVTSLLNQEDAAVPTLPVGAAVYFRRDPRATTPKAKFVRLA